MSIHTDGSPTAWEQWYFDTYGSWPAQQAVTSAQTTNNAVVAPTPAAAPAAAPVGPVSANPWGTFNGDFQKGLSQDLINWYQQQAASKTGPTYMDPTYGQTWGTMGEQKYFDDPTGRYRISMQDGYSAPFTDEYGRQMVYDKNGNVHPYDPSYTQGFNVWDTQTQMGGAYDASGKYKGALNLKQEIDPMDLVGLAMIAAPFAAAIGGVGAGAAGAGAGTTGGAGAATGAGITGFGDAGLMYGGANAAAAGTLGGGGAALGTAAAGAAGAGGAGGAAGGSWLDSLGSLLGGGGGGMSGGFNWGSLIGPATQLIGGYMNSSASKDASDAQLQAAREAMALQEPWRQAGIPALNRMQELLGIGGNPSAQGYGSYAQPFKFTNDDPSYQWRLDQGLKSVKNAYAGKGSFLSGSAMKGINDYAQGAASTEYGAAFNRDQAQKTNNYNRLASLAGTGQTAANTIGEYGTQAGNAKAAGTVGSANAWGNALSGAFNSYQQNELLNRLLAR